MKEDRIQSAANVFKVAVAALAQNKELPWGRAQDQRQAVVYLETKPMRQLIFLAIIGFSLALAACDQKPKDEQRKIDRALEKAKKSNEDGIEELRSYANKKRQQYQEKAEAVLNSYEKRVDELKAQANKAGGEAKKKFDEAVVAWREKQKALKKQLEEFKTASAKAWEEMEKKIDAGLEELKKLYEKARAAIANRKAA